MKKKGFTLIELLAVIVILAIIAFILIPVIQDLIDNARYASAVNSVMNYVKGANMQASLDAGGFEEFVLNSNELETGLTDDELAKIKYKGKGPTYVYLSFDETDRFVAQGRFCIWGYSIDYSHIDGVTKSTSDYCGGGGAVPEPEGTLSCDAMRDETYDTTENFKIKNIEDLVCISEMSKTKDFTDKTIYLINSVDFNEDSSYKNPNSTEFGDINGNGEVEGIKTELTTDGGFYPIGIDNVFNGTFEGYAKAILNLMINRNRDDVGLIGSNKGTVRGLEVTANITGANGVGGIVGTNNGGTINETIFTGNITATDWGAGGIVGYSKGGLVRSVLVRDANVKSNKATGGIIGYGDNGVIVSGIIEGGTVTGTHYPGIIAGRDSSGSYTGYYASGRISGTTGRYNGGGTEYTLNDEILNGYDTILDTYIGGDNDDSGYYFDYENETNSNIVIKNTTKDPITFTLKGSGTEENPYIIDSYQHYKEAATLAGKDENYKFKVTNDIDFNDRHYYALGTYGNLLSGDIDGDMHTLSNASFSCLEVCGMIGKIVDKTIEGFYLANISVISGSSDVGGFVGRNEGTIKGITATNMNVTGTDGTGGIVGSSIGTIDEIIVDSTVTSTAWGAGSIVGYSHGGQVISVLVKNANIKSNNGTGGIIGYGDNGVIVSGIIEGGTVTGNHYPGIIAGRDSSGSYTGYYASGRISGTTGNYNGGGSAFELNDEIINGYDAALDTYIGGDNDDSGYYFDYENDNSSNIVIKRIKDYPITFTLSGNGSDVNPYIIDSYQHYKEATILAKDEYKFKITANIDFDGKHYYALGTNGNVLGSNIDGDMHTLSNISFACFGGCGLISKNVDKTIEGLNINNITIKSINSDVGGVVGLNKGTVKGINLVGSNITGSDGVGIIVGTNEGGTINEVTSIGNVTASGWAAGGIVGYSHGGTIKSVLVKSANIKSNNGTGGIAGYGDNGVTLVGVIEGGTVTGNHFPGIIAGRDSSGSYTAYYASNRISGTTGRYNGGGEGYTLIPPVTVTYSSTEIDSLTYYDNLGALDTVIGGDGDGSGYYLQYNNSGDGIIVVKAGNTPTPSPTPDPGSGEPLESNSVGDNPPTCVLEQVISRDSGLQPVLTCTDEEGAPTIRSQWNVNKNATTNQFSDIGIVKNGTVNGNSKTVRPYWSTSDPISVPTRDTCYYFRFGAQDASGNWSYYVTTKCYYGFGRSND